MLWPLFGKKINANTALTTPILLCFIFDQMRIFMAAKNVL